MANGRGGKRPGAGRKPGSKSRTTTKVGRTLSEMAAEYTPEALTTLAEVMQDKSATASARVLASNSLLDRAHGKPVQATLEVKAEDAPHAFDGWHIERAQPDTPDPD